MTFDHVILSACSGRKNGNSVHLATTHMPRSLLDMALIKGFVLFVLNDYDKC